MSDHKFCQGQPVQWGSSPDNTLVIMEQAEGRYILLVAAEDLRFPSGEQFNADLGDIITLSSQLVDIFSKALSPQGPGALQVGSRIHKAIAVHLRNRAGDGMGHLIGVSLLLADIAEA